MSSPRRLIVASNRGPIVFGHADDGSRTTRRGGGGLVTALSGLISGHDVTWIASAVTEGDREVALEQDCSIEEHDRAGNAFRLRLLPHDPLDYDRYYNVLANPLLWFVQHELWPSGLAPDVDHGTWEAWRAYRRVNTAFAEAVIAEADAAGPGATVMLHDYQLYLVGAEVRAARPDLVLTHFVHIPWPGKGAWRVLPTELREAIGRGLLACDVVGLHVEGYVDEFLHFCEALPGATVDWTSRSVRCDGRETLVRAYPISVDAEEFDALAVSPAVQAAEVALVQARPERLILRVDRTDPSKNIVRGLKAFDRLLEQRPDWRGRVRFLVLLDPSRLEVPEYANYLAEVLRTARAVGERWAMPDGTPAIDLRIHDNFPEAVAAYRQYDVLLVNALADGMNLIAKEAPLVNARDGVLVLSETVGAHDELGPFAISVNPFDIQGQAEALAEALELPEIDRTARAAGLRDQVRQHDVRAWLAHQLDDLDALAAVPVTEPLLIVAALNGTRDRKVSKGVPYTAAELAKEAKAAVEAGAGIVHVHARREDGTPVFDLTYDDVLTAIRSAVDVPISISTQRQRQTSLGTVTALFSVLSELPDLATVNVAPLAPDLPAHREEARQILEALDAAGVAAEPVVPTLEALADLAALYEDGLLAHAPWMHIALGGRPAEAEHGLAGTPQNLLRLVEALDGSAGKLRWIAHGLGSATPPVCATAAAVGGWIRVGLEDSALLPDGSVARSNAELVELAVALADAVGREPVEPAEARRLFSRGEE